MPAVRFLLLLPAILFPAACADLFKDDFSRFPAGKLSAPVGELNPAIQEYHYLPHRGVPLWPWANPIVHNDSWVVSDEDGKPYLEQHLVNSEAGRWSPLFITGDPEWFDYSVEVRVRPLSFAGKAGLVFRYHTNRHHFAFFLTQGNTAKLAVQLPIETRFRVAEWHDLVAARFDYTTDRYYLMRVENRGPRIIAFIDGQKIVEAESTETLKGKAGVTADVPARFMDFRVEAPDETARQIQRRIETREKELEGLRTSNPRPKLWRRFRTPGFGAGRNVRFGDLDGDGQPEMLIAQNIPRVRGDAFSHISCLTAVSLEGRVLWQKGKPDPRNGLLTNDNPFQIHDLDGDGRKEVILVQDFRIKVLEGATGRLLRSAPMPPMRADLKERPYERNSGDSIAFLDLNGRGRRSHILIKDRYQNFWIFDRELKLLWQGEGQLGHYPFPFDIDGDGRDEFAIGYALWSPDGRQIWSRDRDYRDHADGIVVGNFTDDPKAPPRVYATGSDEGFLLFDLAGRNLKHVRIGHAQSPSIAKYRADVPGLQMMVSNFWRNPGIITLFDADGNILAQEEPVHHASPLLPVNWRGDGVEFAMLSANTREGGLIDGHLRRVVMFPDDGHPDLAYDARDLTGDARDEIVVWNTDEVWIYTQDPPFKGARIYAPLRSPDCNESNYRATVSLPAWRHGPSEAGRVPAQPSPRPGSEGRRRPGS